MTHQHLDTIEIEDQNHWLAQSIPILPPGHAQGIGLETEPESTANYKGWDAHWTIENGRMWLAELSVFGFLGRKKLKPGEERADQEEYRAGLITHCTPRRICFREIFGTEPPVFAAWVSQKV